jgi:hypothetical protein
MPVRESNCASSSCLRRGPFSLLAGLTMAAMMLVCDVQPMIGQVHAANGQGAGPINPVRFEGNWVRPDGGYLLQVKDVKKDGSLKAAYFNRRPINVGRAELRKQGGELVLVVELRDVNYPGSTYNLRYDRSDDRLKGSYYQAVDKQTYEVEFVKYQDR